MSMRAAYSRSIAQFLRDDEEAILGELTRNHRHRQLEDMQIIAWRRQIRILQAQLVGFDGHIYFEFMIPRMGRRVDNVILLGERIYVLEFKVGSSTYNRSALEQVIDYALDLKNFHEGSHKRDVIPVLLADEASAVTWDENAALNQQGAICVYASNLADYFKTCSRDGKIEAEAWETSAYKPTPTIIEAAQALPSGCQRSACQCQHSARGYRRLRKGNLP